MPARPSDPGPESVGGDYSQVPTTDDSNGVVADLEDNHYHDVATDLPKERLDVPRQSGQFSYKKTNGARTASFNLHSNPYARNGTEATFKTDQSGFSRASARYRKGTVASALKYKENTYNKLDTLERVRYPPLFGGLIAEYKHRFQFWKSDWTDGLRVKTISSSLFMFLETFASTIALAVTVASQTDNRFGPIEFIIGNAISGLFDTLFGNQPLTVFRPTGGDALLLVQISVVYDLVHDGGLTDVSFHTFYAYVGIFVGIYSLMICAFEMSRWIKYTTRFIHDLLATFVCSIYIVDGAKGIYRSFTEPQPGASVVDMDAALWGVFLTAVGVFLSMWWLHARGFDILSHEMRDQLSEWALIISVFVGVVISYFVSDSVISLQRVELDSGAHPTLLVDGAPRAWFADYGGMSGTMVVVAAATAFPCMFYFYFAQNITAVMFQAPDMKLKKGSYYHTTFFMLGIMAFFFSGFGLPFCISVLPHPLQFLVSMADRDENGDIVRVHESRLTALCVFVLIGLPVFVPQIVRIIPESAVNHILIFIGFSGLLIGNQIVEKLMLVFTAPSEWPKDAARAPYALVAPSRMYLFTFFQMVLIAIVWGLNVSPAGVAFPLVLLFCIPVRKYVLPRIFTERELRLLDSDGTSLKDDEPLLTDVLDNQTL